MDYSCHYYFLQIGALLNPHTPDIVLAKKIVTGLQLKADGLQALCQSSK